jgi:dTDP-glucose 4,6-dehydratase
MRSAASERCNVDVVKEVCRVVDILAPDSRIGSREALVEMVADRPGHDLRYAIDASKIGRELG